MRERGPRGVFVSDLFVSVLDKGDCCDVRADRMCCVDREKLEIKNTLVS